MVYVKGHYRIQNGKRVYVKPHTRIDDDKEYRLGVNTFVTRHQFGDDYYEISPTRFRTKSDAEYIAKRWSKGTDMRTKIFEENRPKYTYSKPTKFRRLK